MEVAVTHLIKFFLSGQIKLHKQHRVKKTEKENLEIKSAVPLLFFFPPLDLSFPNHLVRKWQPFSFLPQQDQ